MDHDSESSVRARAEMFDGQNLSDGQIRSTPIQCLRRAMWSCAAVAVSGAALAAAVVGVVWCDARWRLGIVLPLVVEGGR